MRKKPNSRRIEAVCEVCKITFMRNKYTKDHMPICSKECRGKLRYNSSQEERKVLFNEGKLKYRKRIRTFLLEEHGNICQICKQSEWLDKPIPLQVDHIDGNASNNTPLNLRMICYNCNAQLPTFAGRNRGSGRKARGLKAYE